MPSAYKWRPLPAGALGRSSNPETIRRNEHRANLTPLETAFERARANRGNRLKQHRVFARSFPDYLALADDIKAEVDQEMVVEENEVLEQERRAILADWRQYYPNQFDQHGLPLPNPPIPIEVPTPPGSPLASPNRSPKVRPAARMKNLLERVTKRPRSHTTGSPSFPRTNTTSSMSSPSFPPPSSSPPAPLQPSPPRVGLRERTRLFQARTVEGIRNAAPLLSRRSSASESVPLSRTSTLGSASTVQEPASKRTRLRIGLGRKSSDVSFAQPSMLS
jgi:hypothetical protein